MLPCLLTRSWPPPFNTSFKTGLFFCLLFNTYISFLLFIENVRAEANQKSSSTQTSPNNARDPKQSQTPPMNVTSQSNTPQCVCHIVDPNGRPVVSQGINQNYNYPPRYPPNEDMEYYDYSSYNQYGNAGVESVQYESFYANNLINDSITHPVTSILNKLLTNYDRRLRPQYGGDPVAVNVTMNIDSIGPISEVNMNFRLDISFRQYWKDQRLSFNHSEPVTVNSQFLDEIWQPDTYFPDSYESQRQTVMVPNILLRIYPDGLVLYSARVTVIAKCPMDLMYFPMDVQQCRLMVECFGYTTKDLQLKWKETPNSRPVEYDQEKLQLAQFKLINVETKQYNLQFSTGEFSDLEVVFFLKRDLIYFIIQTYIPATLTVLLSWVNFYVNRHSVPARASLAITTVLTMITLMGSTNSNLPKVSSIKAIDIYFGICLLYVFGALVEFALVCYFNKPRYTTVKQDSLGFRGPGGKIQSLQNSAMVGIPWRQTLPTKMHPSNGMTMTSGEYGGFLQGASTPMDDEGQPFLSTSLTSHTGGVGVGVGTGVIGGAPNMAHHYENHFLPGNSTLLPNSFNQKSGSNLGNSVSMATGFDDENSQNGGDDNQKMSKKQRRKMRRRPVNKPIDVSKIDLYSRIMFPLTYIMICIIYWMVYIGVTDLTQSQKATGSDS